jgi:membrane fusion protein (multidrug efflux system)
MRRPLSLWLQGLVAVIVLVAGAALWVARGPVAAAVSSVFSTGAEQPKGRVNRGKKRRGRGNRAVPVVIEKVAQGRNDLVFSGIGTARAVHHITLYPGVSGEVVKVFIRAGDRVKKGGELIKLDIRQAQLAVDMAQSKLQIAQRLVGRADRLRRSRVQSQAKVLDATTLADQARVQLKTAQVSLTDHTIKAPFAGVVGIASVGVGDRVTPATALVTLDDRSLLTVEFDVPEQYLPRLSNGMQLDVRTPGFADRTFVGKIDGIDSRVHPTRRTVVVRAAVSNAKDILRPGMSFEVDLKLPGANYPRIPDLALQFSQAGNYIWLIVENKAKRVPVKIVRRDSNTVLVRGELQPGDTIVIEGVQRLRPGRPVEISASENTNPVEPRNKANIKLN